MEQLKFLNMWAEAEDMLKPCLFHTYKQSAKQWAESEKPD